MEYHLPKYTTFAHIIGKAAELGLEIQVTTYSGKEYEGYITEPMLPNKEGIIHIYRTRIDNLGKSCGKSHDFISYDSVAHIHIAVDRTLELT